MTIRKEYQVKVAGVLDQAHLLELGAEPLGTCNQQDVYIAGESVRRIRIEGDKYFYAEKGHDVGSFCRVRNVTDELIPQSEADRLINQCGVRAVVCKTRALYQLNGAVIALDEVEQLGTFSEIRAESEAGLTATLDRLGLHPESSIRASYLDMMEEKKLPSWRKALIRFHDRMGELTFGVTSGILTTAGVLMGVHSASASRLAIMASLVSVAMADSWSDAFGMFNSKMSERGVTRASALRFAGATLVAKMTVPLLFVVPVATLPLPRAINVCLAIGAILLSLLSAEQALVSQKPVARLVCRNLVLALFIINVSRLAGKAIGWMFG
jgi:adenylate cyclase class IV/VIT1/CCC1 family predicted Fe2+/Mn2+ transporter